MKLFEILKKRDNSLSGTVRTVAVLNLLLAVIALLKDIFMAGYMGTTGEADALLLAYSTTDILGNNLFAAAIGTSCIPVFSSLYIDRNKNEFEEGIKVISAFVFAASLLLFFLLLLFKDEIMGALGIGFHGQTLSICIELFIIMLPTLLMYPAAAVGTSAMQVSGRFTIPAAAPLVFNAVYLLPLLSGYILKVPVGTGVYYTGVSITAGVLIMVLMIWYPLYKRKTKLIDFSHIMRVFRPLKFDVNILRKVLGIFAPYILILLLTQGVLYIERYIASGLGEGSIASLNYAYRISQFPVWVFTAAVGTVVYPLIARYIGQGNYEKTRGVIDRALRTVLLVTVPVSLFLLIMRVPVISVLFMRGAFDFSSLRSTSDILFGYCLAIGGQSAAAISLKVLLSSGGMKKAIWAYGVSFVINVCIDLYLTPAVGIAGLGYGAAAGGILNGLLTYAAVRSMFGNRHNIKFRPAAGAAAANILVLLVSLVFINIWYKIVYNSGFILQSGYIFGCFALCGVLYCFVLYKTGSIQLGGVRNE